MSTQIIDLNPKLADIPNKDIVQRMYIHSCYKRLPDGDVLVIKEKVKTKDDTILNNIRCIKNPKRTFYITKPQYRTHNYKKEYEYIDRLDEYQCYNFELLQAVKKALGMERKFIKSLRSLCNNPYVYKADIPIDALVKMHYQDLHGNQPLLPIDIGFLDIEADPSSDEIVIISVSHNNHIYTAFLKNRMYQENSNGKLQPFTLEELIQKSHEFYKDEIEQHNIKLHFYPAENEADMITYIFKTIQKNHTDIIGIWNLGYDIPEILKSVKKLNLNPISLFTHPSIPDEFKYVRYKEDKSNVDHFTLKWHWLYNTSSTQFVDSMGLYSQLRKTAGFEPSYSLEYILSKYGEKGKVLNLDLAGHIHYSNRRFLDYIIYNQYDVMGLYIMEKKNNDFLQLMINSRIVPLHEFNLATRTVTYEHFYYFSKQGKIISSAGNDPITEEHLIQRYYKKKYGVEVKKDKTIPKFGGAVLRPERCKNVGINIFDRKNPFNENNETLVHLAISDIDLSSAYPTNTMTYNISRSTSAFTVFNIEDRHQLDVHLLFNNLVALRENSVYLCNEFLGLPNYLDLVD